MKLLKPLINNKEKQVIKSSNDSDAKRQKLYNQKFKTISELAPYISLQKGQYVVICIDDSIIANNSSLKSFAEDVVLLKQFGINPVVVHNADYGIKTFFEKHKIDYQTFENQIVVNSRNIELVEMVCSTYVNKAIVSAIHDANGSALGISGKDGRLIEADKSKVKASDHKSNLKMLIDNSLSGVPAIINPSIFACFEESEVIPVVSPIGFHENSRAIYLDSLSVSGCITSAIIASKMIIITNESIFVDENNEVITELDSDKALKYIEKFSNHQYQSLHFAINTVNWYSESVHFVSNKIDHALIFELLSDERPGTMIIGSF